MSLLRALDPNFAKRELRARILVIQEQLGLRDPVPHSFETDALLKHAIRIVSRRDLKRRTDLARELLAAAGTAYGLIGDDAASWELFEQGLKLSRRNQKKARFHYLRGFQYYHRRGEAAKAKEELLQAYRLSERSRRLRTESLLALGTAEMRLGCLPGAKHSFSAALDLHVTDLAPHALLRLSVAYMREGDHESAAQLNRRSYSLFRRHGNWLGMKTADANLALLLLAQHEPAPAREALERAVAEGVRVLDLPRLGRDFNNLAIACREMGDLEASRDALVQAIRYHGASGRRSLLAGNYRNLGLCLADLGQLEAGIASLEHGARMANELGMPNHEFEILADLLTVCLENETRVEAIPGLLRRCHEIMDIAADRLSRDSLLQFGQAMQEIVEQQKLGAVKKPRGSVKTSHVASTDGRNRLREIVPSEESCDFDGLLRRKLGRGIPGRLVPDVSELRQFLMMFAGDYFKSASYTGEFGMTQERAKRHFRWMCGQGVLERYGTRKASRYALAFHRVLSHRA